MNSGETAPDDGLLIIVNFDQSQEIRDFLQESEKYFPKTRTIIVDDGSTDGSDRIAESFGYTVIRHGRNRGVGAALRTGLKFAESSGYRWVLISAANGKMLPREFARVFGPVARGEADYVQGNRFHPEGASPGLTRFRRMMIPIFSEFASVAMGRRFRDITCGFRAYRLEVVRAPGMDIDQAWLDRYELEYYIHFKAVRANRWRFLEVPVTMSYGRLATGRTSKIQPFTGWWSMIRPFVFLALGLKR